MKTLHANKDYYLRYGHIDILKPEYINNASYSPLCLAASTDKSLPVKHIDRSVFVKPVDVEDYASGYADRWDNNVDVFNGVRLAFVDGYNSNPNQFTLDDMKKAISKAIAMASDDATFHSDSDIHKAVLEELSPLSLPPTIDCNENYDNIKCNW